MASSFASQIPAVVWVAQQLRPRCVLDIGKGFGKYGFLLHEYVGIDQNRRPDPTRSLREQSSLVVDGLDVNTDYSFPHLSQVYRNVLIRDVTERFDDLRGYDLVLMCDVIEHLPKDRALRLVRHFLADGARVLIATPRDFFEQNLYGSEAERHVSHWMRADFAPLGHVEAQRAGPGMIYLISAMPLRVNGFGNRFSQRLRRIARAVLDEV